MIGMLVRRVVSLLLLAVVAVGGGRLPTVDALVFHEAVANPETFGSHFEASSACHDDGCSVRSVTHESRFTPSIGTPAVKAAAPENDVPPPAIPAPSPAATSTSNLSRAPPLSV